MSWPNRAKNEELDSIIEALAILLELNYFERIEEDLRISLLAGTTATDDSVIVNSVKTYRAHMNLIHRLKSEAASLVQQTNSGE